ncbi:MAG: class I SAM-dependent methyltransferase [Deltaproteobacteria bacterium]|nr:class I SAM-dependent methyltransferase [Deltaproteobacteria bacterium]
MALTYEQALAQARQKASEADFGSPMRYRITRAIPALIRRYCPPQADVLDIGCGSGRYAWFFVEAGIRGRYTGADIDPHSLDGFELADLFSSKLLAMDAHDLESLNERFDFVLSITAHEHFEDDARVTRGMAHVMRPGATALIVVPSHTSYPLYGKHGFRRYSRAQTARLGAEAGLELLETGALCGAASWLFHLAWFVPAHAARLAGKTLLFATHGMDRERARRSWPRALGALDRMGEHHLRWRWGRAAHRFGLRAAAVLDRVFPFFAVAYLAVFRKPDAAAARP